MKKLLQFFIAAVSTFTVTASYGATLNEGFEASTANGSYYTTATTVTGDACKWSLLESGVFSNEARTGTKSVRLSKQATSSLTMTSNKSGGAGTVSFYGRKWSSTEANAVIEVQYSTNSGSTWTTAGKTTVSATTFTKYNVTVNKTGSVRIRLAQTSGQRAIIDDIAITDYSAPSAAAITSPANNSTVDFGTNAANTTKTMPVVVKGSGLTSATTIAVTGKGFGVNTTTLSASKVNSATGGTAQVNFKGASGGAYSGTLTLTNGSIKVTVKLTATVSGSGTSTPTTSQVIKTPASGSTVDFGTATPGVNKTTTVVVTGSNLTSATTVTISGTGFRTGATSLSAAKVNSATGAQLQLIFNSSTAGKHTGTLTLTSGSLVRKVSLTATVSDGGTPATAEPSTPSTPSEPSTPSTPSSGATNNNIPSGYYSAAEGKCGAALLTALCDIVASHTAVSYSNLWTAFKQTDTKSNGKIWDMYSTKEFTYGTEQCGNYTSIGICYNREHSFPKSWFSDATPMYTDLFHVVPTDGFVNNQRGNSPFGECASGTYVATKNGVSAKGKLGKSTVAGYTGTVWEPDDDYKGDFARSYFYMAAAYNKKIAGWSSDMLNKTAYPAFADWAINMLLRWNTLDPVSTKETARQEAVYAKQKNRNPFIDFPDLAEYIWGSKKTTAWSASASATSRISQPANGSTLNFGTVATGATNEKIVSVKGVSVTDNVQVAVQGDGFEASAEWLDASAVNPRTSARRLAAAAEPEEDGALLKITFMVPDQSDYTGTLVLKSGDITNTVKLQGKALDGLPAAEAENIGADCFTARWVNVGDALSGGYYKLDVTDDGVSLPGYPRNVDADALAYEVTGLQPEHSYEYSLTNATAQSNIISVSTTRPVPTIEYMIMEDDAHLIAQPGAPSTSIGIELAVENITQDITFSVQAPFQVSADNVNWDRQAVVNADAAQVFVRLGATNASGEYLTSLRATAPDFIDDSATITGEVTSTGGSATYLVEDFEADATGCNSYATKTYNGTAASWELTNALLVKVPEGQVYYEGNYSLRLGTASAHTNVEMLDDAIEPQSTVTFKVSKWNYAKEKALTIGIDFSDDKGATWTNAKTVTIDKIASTPDEYTTVSVPLNNVAPGRIRIRKDVDAGGRGLVDYIAVSKNITSVSDIAADVSGWKVYSSAAGEITVTTAAPATVTVVGVDGKVYYSAVVDTTATIAVPVGQLYIVTSPGKFPRRLVL